MKMCCTSHGILLSSPIMKKKQRGIALIISLLILVIMTLLGLSMFRNFSLTEKMAGNTLEKQRSLQAAQSALQYGEWWLSQGNGTSGLNDSNGCNVVYDANVSTNVRVCSTALANPTSLPWAARGDYLSPNMTVASGGGLTSAGDINYSKPASLYISYLGIGTTNSVMFFQVTGAGYGGSLNGASVVQSIYTINVQGQSLDRP